MTKSYEELLADMTGIIAKIYEKGYDKGYEQGKFDATMDSAIEKYDGALGKMAEETPQEKRDRIIEKAKKDVDELKEDDGMYKIYPYACTAEYIVNKDKRTVVVLMRGRSTGRVRARGIAKAHPNDCFNVHIGKAIALRRALGLEVPSEYLNAPQPTEVRVGDVVYLITSDLRIPYTRVISKVSNDYITYTNGGEDSIKHVYKNGKIIDDSRDGEASE